MVVLGGKKGGHSDEWLRKSSLRMVLKGLSRRAMLPQGNGAWTVGSELQRYFVIGGLWGTYSTK